MMENGEEKRENGEGTREKEEREENIKKINKLLPLAHKMLEWIQ